MHLWKKGDVLAKHEYIQNSKWLKNTWKAGLIPLVTRLKINQIPWWHNWYQKLGWCMVVMNCWCWSITEGIVAGKVTVGYISQITFFLSSTATSISDTFYDVKPAIYLKYQYVIYKILFLNIIMLEWDW